MKYLVVIAAAFIAIAVWLALQLLAPTAPPLAWLLLPTLAGTLWWVDSHDIRTIASWVVPLTVVMLFAVGIPGVYGVILATTATLCSALMAFSETARDIWLRKVLSRTKSADQTAAPELVELGMQLQSSLREYGKDADHQRVHRLALSLLERTRAIEYSDPAAQEAVRLLVDHLTSLANVTERPWLVPPPAYASLESSWQKFSVAIRALSNQPKT